MGSYLSRRGRDNRARCGDEFEFVTAVRDAIENGTGIGPRMVLAGIVDGSGPEGVGVDKADSPAEAVRIAGGTITLDSGR